MVVKKYKRRNRFGFTLIELMTVLSVIGVLATIALPQFAQYRMRAFDVTAVSDLSQFKTAVLNDRYQFTGWGAGGILDTTGPHSKFGEVMISNDVRVTSSEVVVNGVPSLVAFSCHLSGDATKGYLIIVPYASGNIGIPGIQANVIDENAVWRVNAGC